MPVDVDHQQSVRDPAQPTYIFRGHAAQIHSVGILRRNTCLLTGDADGWVVFWKLETKRPLAVWKAHDAAILGTAEWGPAKIITHGRDNTLRIWQLRGGDAAYSTVLPADGADTHRPKPWLLHTLPVNTLNFCAFTTCYQRGDIGAFAPSTTVSDEPIFIAVPGRDDKNAEVYQFPEEKLLCVVPRIDTAETGMVMAVKLVHHQPSNNILVITGYEGGFTAVHLVPRNPKEIGLAETIYLSQPHTQPILSVDALPDGSTYFTSSADATIAAHRIPELSYTVDVNHDPPEDLGTSDSNLHEDEQHDGRLATDESTAQGTAGTPANASSQVATKPPNPSSSAPNSDTESIEPLSFPKKRSRTSKIPPPNPAKQPARPSGLSSLLASAPPQQGPTSTARPAPPVTVQPAYKTINTRHAGQQSLRVRSDGRLLVTGGWDSRVRVYSSKTLKEVAVLKWHKEGVYAVAFGEVLEKEDLQHHEEKQKAVGKGTEVAKKETGLAKLQRQKEEAVQVKHWVAAGAKDGKVSLWEVF